MEEMRKRCMGKRMNHDGESTDMDNTMRQRMGMMKNMMNQSNPRNDMASIMQMCRNMTQSVAKSADMASFATEEIRGLFQDWLSQVETEVLTSIQENGGQIDIAEISSQLSISEKSARYIVGALFQKGAINLGQVHVAETQTQQDGETENSGQADTTDE